MHATSRPQWSGCCAQTCGMRGGVECWSEERDRQGSARRPVLSCVDRMSRPGKAEPAEVKWTISGEVGAEITQSGRVRKTSDRDRGLVIGWREAKARVLGSETIRAEWRHRTILRGWTTVGGWQRIGRVSVVPSEVAGQEATGSEILRVGNPSVPKGTHGAPGDRKYGSFYAPRVGEPEGGTGVSLAE